MNNELKDIISDVVLDEEELNTILVLEGDEFADGAIGLTHDNHLVYDYDKLVSSLVKHGYTEEDAIDWLDYNTLGSLIGNMEGYKKPIIITYNFNN